MRFDRLRVEKRSSLPRWRQVTTAPVLSSCASRDYWDARPVATLIRIHPHNERAVNLKADFTRRLRKLEMYSTIGYLPGSKRSRHSYGCTVFSGFHTK